MNSKASCTNCALAALCLPGGLDPPAIDQLSRIVRRRRVLRGEHLFRAGDSLQSLYAVHSGAVKTYLTAKDGNEQILNFYLPGDLLGLDALERESHTCSAIAMDTVHICELLVCQLEEMCHVLPKLPHKMLKLLGREVATSHAMLLLLGKKSALERLATFLFSVSVRLQQRGFSEREFNLSMPRDDIANYLGLARETVSRLFSYLQEDGLLTVQRKHVRIHDMDRLRALASLTVSN